MWSQTLAACSPVSLKAASTSSRFMAPIGSTPSNPASFMTLTFSSTEPFTPMVEYMMALRRFRFGFEVDAAEAAEAKANAAAPAIVILRNDRRFMGSVWPPDKILEKGCTLLFIHEGNGGNEEFCSAPVFCIFGFALESGRCGLNSKHECEGYSKFRTDDRFGAVAVGRRLNRLDSSPRSAARAAGASFGIGAPVG